MKNFLNRCYENLAYLWIVEINDNEDAFQRWLKDRSVRKAMRNNNTPNSL